MKHTEGEEAYYVVLWYQTINRPIRRSNTHRPISNSVTPHARASPAAHTGLRCRF